MVKTLSEFPQVTGYRTGRNSIPANPAILSSVAQIINACSFIEASRAKILAYNLGSDLQVTMAVLRVFRGSDYPKKALKAAAEHALSDEEATVLDRIETITKDTFDVRNKLAHWIWGSCDELPDALLLQPPAFDSEQLIAFPDSGAYILPPPHDQVLVYGITELEGLAENAWKSAENFSRFQHHLHWTYISQTSREGDPPESDEFVLRIKQGLHESFEKNWAYLSEL